MNLAQLVIDAIIDRDMEATAFAERMLGKIKVLELSEEDIALLARLGAKERERIAENKRPRY